MEGFRLLEQAQRENGGVTLLSPVRLRQARGEGIAYSRARQKREAVFMALSRRSNSKARALLAQPRGRARKERRAAWVARPVSAKRLSGPVQEKRGRWTASRGAASDSEAKKRVKTGYHKFRFRRAARSAESPRGKAQRQPPNARPASPGTASREREIWSRAAGRFSRFGFIFLEEKGANALRPLSPSSAFPLRVV
ncbi:hypothetical protein MRX96_016563 [Rhipicephalus microplus]